MEQILCCYCGDFFPPSPRHKRQVYCMKPRCQRVRKAAWQREKMQTDPDYRVNQKLSQKQWAKANPDYWRQYRKRNPKKAERNRILQSIRNRRARAPQLIAKMDTLKFNNFKILGQFWLIPVIAKMDALKVNIFTTSSLYP